MLFMHRHAKRLFMLIAFVFRLILALTVFLLTAIFLL